MGENAGLGDQKVIAFAATTDPQQSKQFYQAVLGLRHIADEEFAIVFDAGGTMLRIQKTQAHTPPPFTVLGWRVDDIHTVIDRLAAVGVEMTRYPGFGQDDAGVWTAPGGAQIAWFRDPDGNVLSLTAFNG